VITAVRIAGGVNSAEAIAIVRGGKVG